MQVDEFNFKFEGGEIVVSVRARAHVLDGKGRKLPFPQWLLEELSTALKALANAEGT